MNFKHPLILASSSPRRQFLMREIGFDFSVRTPDIDESFPVSMPADQIPAYLAERKARVFETVLTHEVVLSSDTVVVLQHEILNKPADRSDAIRMINMLSGTTHTVITSFCILTKNQCSVFTEQTNVTFRTLSRTDIELYIDRFKPFDKAGSYGAQECLPPGFNPCSLEEIQFLQQIGKTELIEKSLVDTRPENRVAIIQKIEGSYFNVMGLPIHKVYEALHTIS